MRPSYLYLGLLPVVNTQPFDNEFHRVRRGSCVPPSLKSYEAPFNWLHLHPGYPLSHAELHHGILIMEEKCQDEFRNFDSILLGRGQYSSSLDGISLIARKFAEAQFNIELQRYSRANECLQEAESFICKWSATNPNPEYTQGFFYVLEGLDIFLKIQISIGSPTSTHGTWEVRRRNAEAAGYSIERLKMFRRLPAKAKYTVWTARDVFLIYCSRANVDRINWMDTILLEMEPYVLKWHFYLYRGLHGRRKVVRRPLALMLLDDDELDETEGTGGNGQEAGGKLKGRSGAAAAGVVDDDPLSISYQCMCLAQMFTETECRAKWTDRGNWDDDGKSGGGGHYQEQPGLNQYYPWRFGVHTFETVDQVLECMLEKTIHVLEMDCHLDGVYLNLSEVYMFILPPEHRSMKLSLRCLKKALRLNSNNPKTHYRLGLAHFKLKNHKQAANHFREAVRNPNNIGAIFGLLQLLMANPAENYAEIQSIFKLTLKNVDLIRVWDKRCFRTLHYLKGCFHFMLQDTKLEETTRSDSGTIMEVDCLNEAITSWIIAHDNESPKWSYYFLNLSHQSDVFHWPIRKLNLSNVSNALKNAAYLERTQFRQLLLDICAEVDDAIRRRRRSSANDRNSILTTPSSTSQEK